MEFDTLNILQKKKGGGVSLVSFFLSFFLSFIRSTFFLSERKREMLEDLEDLGGGGGGGGRDPNNGGPTSSRVTSALPNQHGRVLLGMRDKHHHRRPEERAMMDVVGASSSSSSSSVVPGTQRVREDVRMRAQSLRFRIHVWTAARIWIHAHR